MAATASAKSSELSSSACASTLYSHSAARVDSMPRRRPSLNTLWARGGPAARRRASLAAASASASSATTSLASPMRTASAASTRVPSISISVARPSPTSCGSRNIPPSGAMMPRLTHDSMKYALSAAMRKSQASASSQPAPTAGPLTAATVGLGHSFTALIAPWKLR